MWSGDQRPRGGREQIGRRQQRPRLAGVRSGTLWIICSPVFIFANFKVCPGYSDGSRTGVKGLPGSTPLELTLPRGNLPGSKKFQSSVKTGARIFVRQTRCLSPSRPPFSITTVVCVDVAGRPDSALCCLSLQWSLRFFFQLSEHRRATNRDLLAQQSNCLSIWWPWFRASYLGNVRIQLCLSCQRGVWSENNDPRWASEEMCDETCNLGATTQILWHLNPITVGSNQCFSINKFWIQMTKCAFFSHMKVSSLPGCKLWSSNGSSVCLCQRCCNPTRNRKMFIFCAGPPLWPQFSKSQEACWQTLDVEKRRSENGASFLCVYWTESWPKTLSMSLLPVHGSNMAFSPFRPHVGDKQSFSMAKMLSWAWPLLSCFVTRTVLGRLKSFDWRPRWKRQRMWKQLCHLKNVKKWPPSPFYQRGICLQIAHSTGDYHTCSRGTACGTKIAKPGA